MNVNTNKNVLNKKTTQIAIELLSLVRKAANNQIKIENQLEKQIKSQIDNIIKTNPSFLKNELTKIVLLEKPSTAFVLLTQLNILEILLPELYACIKIKQEEKYHKYNVFEHCLAAMDNTEPVLELRLAALFHDIGKVSTFKMINNKITFYNHEIVSARIAKTIMKRFEFSNKVINKVTELIKLHMFHYTKEWSNGAIRRFIKKAHIDKNCINNLNDHPLFKIRRADRLGKGKNIKEEGVMTSAQKEFQKRIVRVFINDRRQYLEKGSFI